MLSSLANPAVNIAKWQATGNALAVNFQIRTEQKNCPKGTCS
jgi:hypothetical protein